MVWISIAGIEFNPKSSSFFMGPVQNSSINTTKWGERPMSEFKCEKRRNLDGHNNDKLS